MYKILFLIVLLTGSIFGQEAKTSVYKDKDGTTVTLYNDSVVYRSDKVVFKALLFINEDNFFNVFAVARCTDYTYIPSISEGTIDKKDFLEIGMEVRQTPSKDTKIYMLIDTVCKKKAVELLPPKRM